MGDATARVREPPGRFRWWSATGRGLWLQHYDCGLRRPQRRIGVQVRTDPPPPVPQARPFFPFGRSSRDPALPVGEIDCRRGIACRLRHHAGSPSAQPFIASVTRFGPSSTYPTITARCLLVRRPVVLSVRVPQPFAVGRHRPTRPPVSAVQATVCAPGRAHEPARRKSRRACAFGGHEGPPTATDLPDASRIEVSRPARLAARDREAPRSTEPPTTSEAPRFGWGDLGRLGVRRAARVPGDPDRCDVAAGSVAAPSHHVACRAAGVSSTLRAKRPV